MDSPSTSPTDADHWRERRRELVAHYSKELRRAGPLQFIGLWFRMRRDLKQFEKDRAQALGPDDDTTP